MVEFNLFSLFGVSIHFHVHWPNKATGPQAKPEAAEERPLPPLAGSPAQQIPIDIRIVPYLVLPDGYRVKLNPSPPVIEHLLQLPRK